MKVKRGYGRDDKPGNPPGYTLIELLIVVSIMAILSVLSVEFVTGYIAKYKLDSSAKEMAGRLRLAKIASISRNAMVVVQINAGAGKYSAFLDRNKDGAKAAGEPYLNLENAREAATEAAVKIPFGVTVSGAAPANLIYSPPAGVLSLGGAAKGVICFSASVGGDPQHRRLTITPFTGALTLWRSTDAGALCSADSDAGWEKAL